MARLAYFHKNEGRKRKEGRGREEKREIISYKREKKRERKTPLCGLAGPCYNPFLHYYCGEKRKEKEGGRERGEGRGASLERKKEKGGGGGGGGEEKRERKQTQPYEKLHELECVKKEKKRGEKKRGEGGAASEAIGVALPPSRKKKEKREK